MLDNRNSHLHTTLSQSIDATLCLLQTFRENDRKKSDMQLSICGRPHIPTLSTLELQDLLAIARVKEQFLTFAAGTMSDV